ncbi:hypothetical protein H4582DRAFT_131801 [Lactarius indigo]|nr:hypothetical protein H4582DRAFT_131801 [Lactarius indigo]
MPNYAKMVLFARPCSSSFTYGNSVPGNAHTIDYSISNRFLDTAARLHACFLLPRARHWHLQGRFLKLFYLKLDRGEPALQIQPAKKKHPQMLNRLLAGLVHPFIHLAYGFEFGIPGQVAEGLANTAVHPAQQTELVPPSFFSKLPELGILSGLSSKLSLLRIAPVHGEKQPTFAFLRPIRGHPKLSLDTLHSQLEEPRQYRYQAVVPKAGDSIIELVKTMDK